MNSKESISSPSAAFHDPHAVAQYAEGPPRIVPGFADMQRMATLLLAERVPEKGRILVLGAGGGLELKVFAESHPGWTFDGIDPSEAMLALAEQSLGSINARVQLKKGYINDAPDGPFDGATCILTMHFMSVAERKETLAEICRRLKPGAPFVMAHLSMPQDDEQRKLWLSRYVAFAVSSGLPSEKMEGTAEALKTKLSILSTEQEESMLRDAGFENVSSFYSAFTFRGWVAYAPL
jgi:tRNA (cmo5U34)-methyltransferase